MKTKIRLKPLRSYGSLGVTLLWGATGTSTLQTISLSVTPHSCGCFAKLGRQGWSSTTTKCVNWAVIMTMPKPTTCLYLQLEVGQFHTTTFRFPFWKSTMTSSLRATSARAMRLGMRKRMVLTWPMAEAELMANLSTTYTLAAHAVESTILSGENKARHFSPSYNGI